jgi:diacylglycerol O-acyltransferase / wax synthase
MSDAEGLMWRVDQDPHLASTFGTVSILDRPPDFATLLARMERATLAVPRLRWRVQPAPANVQAPSWVDDPDFDIDHHVRRIALPKPGTLRQLLDLSTLLVQDNFDRLRPLWQFIVIEGLRGGKAALVQKMHHTITDGEGGVQMALQYLDFERDAPPPPLAAEHAEVRLPSTATSAVDSVRDVMTGTFRIPFVLARQVREMLVDPMAIPTASAATAGSIRSVLSQLSDVERARSPLWAARSLRRHFETARAPFRDTKDAARRLGGTLNTAFLTAAAEAAGRYHRDLGAPVDRLRTTMAVSTRTSASETNAFSLSRIYVPTGEMAIDERFRAIQSLVSEAGAGTGGASLQALAAVAATLPTSLVTRLARQQAQTIDFATSNVKGSPVPVYVAGAKLLENYPMGPLAGVAFNLTLLSYNGSLDMGINVDAAAVDQPALLARHLEAAFAELATAGTKVRPVRARATASSAPSERRAARRRPRSSTPARGSSSGPAPGRSPRSPR